MSLPQGHAGKHPQGVLVVESLGLFMPPTNIPGVFAGHHGGDQETPEPGGRQIPRCVKDGSGDGS
jgi:hypothetical protein